MSIDDAIKEVAKSAWSHARNCKVSPFECKICKKNIEFFNALPLTKLSELLNEAQATRL